MTHQNDLREWPTSLTHENDPREWPTSLTHENDPRVWHTRITHELDPRELLTSSTHENDPRDPGDPGDPRDLAHSLFTRLRLGVSHLRNYKFKHSFQDLLNPICNYGSDIETTTHYLLHCPLFSDERLILTNNIRNIDNNILNLNDFRFSELLLFGNYSFNNTKYIYVKYHNWIYRLI